VERLRQFVAKHFEFVVVAIVIISILVVHVLIERKQAFLSFYYLPVLLAGYYLGKRQAIGISVLAILAVATLVILTPAAFQQTSTTFYLSLDLVGWAGFLFLTAIIVGLLFEAKQKQLEELRAAYVGIVEILTKYLESTDRYTQGHSLRVANLATDIAIAMELTRREVQNVRTGALLHDIGKVEVSGELIHKAARLTTEEKEALAAHTDKGADILRTVGAVLKDAVPLVLDHHRFYEHGNEEGEKTSGHQPALGARIIAVADAYDAIVTDRPYRKGRAPWQAFREIEQNTPSQFDPAVVEAFRQVMSRLHE